MYMPTLATDLVPDAAAVPAETDQHNSLEVVGDVEQPAFGDYATLLELLDASYKQKSVQIPMKMTSTQSGEIKREEMFPCPACVWISRSKAEAKRHDICFHSHEPLKEIHKKMMALVTRNYHGCSNPLFVPHPTPPLPLYPTPTNTPSPTSQIAGRLVFVLDGKLWT
jgi:hypothetical protein